METMVSPNLLCGGLVIHNALDYNTRKTQTTLCGASLQQWDTHPGFLPRK